MDFLRQLPSHSINGRFAPKFAAGKPVVSERLKYKLRYSYIDDHVGGEQTLSRFD